MSALKNKVKVFDNLNEHQKELISKGHRRIWEAIDCDCEPVFRSEKLNDVISWAEKNNDQVDDISSMVETDEVDFHDYEYR